MYGLVYSMRGVRNLRDRYQAVHNRSNGALANFERYLNWLFMLVMVRGRASRHQLTKLDPTFPIT